MAAPKLRRVRSGDGALQLAAYDYGSPAANAPACLLLHGNGLCARAYEPLSARLRCAGFRVVALDQRGAGASTLPAGGADLTWQRFAEDALAVVDALQLRRCVGFGHSLGGAAMLLAGASSRPQLHAAHTTPCTDDSCAEATRPGTFRCMYLFEPVVAPTGQPGVPHPWDARLAPKINGARNRRRTFPSRQAVRARTRVALLRARCGAEAKHGCMRRPIRRWMLIRRERRCLSSRLTACASTSSTASGAQRMHGLRLAHAALTSVFCHLQGCERRKR